MREVAVIAVGLILGEIGVAVEHARDRGGPREVGGMGARDQHKAGRLQGKLRYGAADTPGGILSLHIEVANSVCSPRKGGAGRPAGWLAALVRGTACSALCRRWPLAAGAATCNTAQDADKMESSGPS